LAKTGAGSISIGRAQFTTQTERSSLGCTSRKQERGASPIGKSDRVSWKEPEFSKSHESLSSFIIASGTFYRLTPPAVVSGVSATFRRVGNRFLRQLCQFFLGGEPIREILTISGAALKI
jgi:hypothetical protein